MTTTFERLFRARTEQGKYLCVGLDPDLAQIPPIHGSKSSDWRVREFMKGIVSETAHVAGVYKPQISYFEALGEDGPRTLKAVINHVRETNPGIPIILDYKRGDIDRSNGGYIQAAFSYFGVDAVTVSPYLGREAMQPFLDYEDKHVFVLCRTSNPGASEFQGAFMTPVLDQSSGRFYANVHEAVKEGASVATTVRAKGMYLYEFVAQRVAQSWNGNGNCGLVVGATAPSEMSNIRRIVGGEMLLLVPGIGTQGGDLQESVQAGRGKDWLSQVFNNSSAISFAYKKPGPDGRTFGIHEWREASRLAAEASNAAIAELVTAR